ncbi:hypothetical protein ACNKHX_01315 [Shigella flexneri]
MINLIERKVDVAIRAGTLTDYQLRARPYLLTVIEKLSPPRLYFPLRETRTIDDFKATYFLGFAQTTSWITADSRSDGQLHEVKYGLSSNSREA